MPCFTNNPEYNSLCIGLHFTPNNEGNAWIFLYDGFLFGKFRFSFYGCSRLLFFDVHSGITCELFFTCVSTRDRMITAVSSSIPGIVEIVLLLLLSLDYDPKLLKFLFYFLFLFIEEFYQFSDSFYTS